MLVTGSSTTYLFFFVSDLLEVVDRRAKIVATELSDEQSSPQPSGSFLLGLVSAWFAA